MGTLGPVLSATGQGRGAKVVKGHQTSEGWARRGCLLGLSGMKMPGLVELERTREELSLALAQLDTLALETSRLQQQPGTQQQEQRLLRERVRLLQESNEQLAQRNDQVTLSFRQVKEEKERLKADVAELRTLSNKLQQDIG